MKKAEHVTFSGVGSVFPGPVARKGQQWTSWSLVETLSSCPVAFSLQLFVEAVRGYLGGALMCVAYIPVSFLALRHCQAHNLGRGWRGVCRKLLLPATQQRHSD